MATVFNDSNNNDVQYISVYDCIASAIRRCGARDSDLTPAIISYAKFNLNVILQSFSNRSIPLFNYQNVVIGLSFQQTQYALPQYVYEILDLNWRRTNPTQYTPTGGVDPNFLYSRNWFEYATTTDFFQLQIYNPKVDTIGLLFFGNQTVTITIQGSTDGSTWTTISQYPTQEYQDGIWMWQDYNPSNTLNYIKVLCGAGETLSLRNIYVADLTSSNEIVMTRLNKDTYWAYPNKFMPMSPIAFYFEKTLTPQLFIWGQPVDVYDWQLHIKWQTNFQNVDKLTQQLSMPYYYIQAVISSLSKRMLYELPPDKVDMSRAQTLAQDATDDLNIAETSQMDMDPISLIPNLSPYTR